MPKGGNGNGNGGNGGGGSKDPKIIDQSFATLENPLDGTSLGYVTSDIRPSKATWSIVSGNDDGAYYIDPITGELFIGDGGAVDFEDEQTRDLIVQVTENGKKDYTATVTVNVTDLNEAPSAGDVTASAAETDDDTTILATVVGSDPDTFADGVNSFNDLSYAITPGSNDDGRFEIDANGNITLAAGKSLDYETTQQHVLQVEVTDGGGLSDTAEVIVNVGDVNEAPEAVVLDFESLASSTDSFVYPGGPTYSEDGYILTNLSYDGGASGFTAPGSSNSEYYAGSTALYNSYIDGVTELRAADGSVFNMLSIDISEFNTFHGNGVPRTVTFTGEISGGGTVEETFVTDGVFGSETFAFSNFMNLTSATWTNSDPYHQFDNINVTPTHNPDELNSTAALDVDSNQETADILPVPDGFDLM